MSIFMLIAGIILVIAGVVADAYSLFEVMLLEYGVTTKSYLHENLDDEGEEDIKTKIRIFISFILGCLAIVGGILLIVLR